MLCLGLQQLGTEFHRSQERLQFALLSIYILSHQTCPALKDDEAVRNRTE